jgi:hypothetical protein
MIAGAFIAAVGLVSSWSASPAAVPVQADLDAFMAQVLERRDENWKKLQQYLLDERQRIDVKGPSGQALWGDDRMFLWYIRDGFFVRSPVTANGVTIGERDRVQAENEFLDRAKRRERGREASTEAPPGETRDADVGDLGGLLSQTRQPQFIDSAYFLRFTFESGRYALVGRERLGADDVLKIEYYPTRLFSHEQNAQDERRMEGRVDRREDREATFERLMNKASMVTLWVDPDARQILKYTFDNVNLNFLPIASLLRVTEVRAAMTMGEPFPDVWLPRDVEMSMGAMLAVGPIDVRYRLDYLNYREATTSGRVVPLAR